MAQRVVHFEVHGKDGERLQRFYASLFGWKIGLTRDGSL
jgi:predicted enzyme related to lactoylglutathione lyase